MTATNNYVWREVVWQRPFTSEDVQSVLTHLASLTSRSFVIWEIRCHEGRFRYLIGCSQKSMSRVEEVFKSHGKVTFLNAAPRKPVSEVKALKLSHPVLSLNTDTVMTTIRATLAAMAGAKHEEEAVVQIVIGRSIRPSDIPKSMPDPTANFIDVLLGKVRDASPEQRKSAKEKSSQFSYECAVRIGLSGERTSTRIYNIISAFRTLESAGVRIRAASEEPSNLNLATIPWRLPLKLSVRELAVMLLLPAGEEELPGTPGLHPKILLPPKWYKEPTKTEEDHTFAVSMDQPEKRLSIPIKDRSSHLYVSGSTGVGKSTVLLNTALKDIEAGHSLLCIDPKSDLIHDLLARISRKRTEDVVLLDITSPTPCGFNPFALDGDPAIKADIILSVFKEMFSDNGWGIRLDDILGAALNTLARTPGATLLWLTPLLTDKDFRRKIVSQIHDPAGLDLFWEHYEAMSDRERNTEIAPCLNRLRQLNLRPCLRNVLGQAQPKFNLADLFTKRRIVLVPLNKGIAGESAARLIGSLIVGLTFNLALSRANIAPAKRFPVSIIIDEFQSYLNADTSFEEGLALARSMNVSYSVANQYMGQLSPEIKQALLANARSKICFNLNAADAKEMAALAPELSPEDYITLPRYEVYTTFMTGGRSTGWIRARTLPPPPPIRMAAELAAKSQRRYGVPAEETEAALIQMLARPSPEANPAVTEAPIGRRKKM